MGCCALDDLRGWVCHVSRDGRGYTVQRTRKYPCYSRQRVRSRDSAPDEKRTKSEWLGRGSRAKSWNCGVKSSPMTSSREARATAITLRSGPSREDEHLAMVNVWRYGDAMEQFVVIQSHGCGVEKQGLKQCQSEHAHGNFCMLRTRHRIISCRWLLVASASSASPVPYRDADGLLGNTASHLPTFCFGRKKGPSPSRPPLNRAPCASPPRQSFLDSAALFGKYEPKPITNRWATHVSVPRCDRP